MINTSRVALLCFCEPRWSWPTALVRTQVPYSSEQTVHIPFRVLLSTKEILALTFRGSPGVRTRLMHRHTVSSAGRLNWHTMLHSSNAHFVCFWRPCQAYFQTRQMQFRSWEIVFPLCRLLLSVCNWLFGVHAQDLLELGSHEHILQQGCPHFFSSRATFKRSRPKRSTYCQKYLTFIYVNTYGLHFMYTIHFGTHCITTSNATHVANYCDWQQQCA